jgi:hypothetical protein
MERSAIRVGVFNSHTFPGFASLHPGYRPVITDMNAIWFARDQSALSPAKDHP